MGGLNRTFQARGGLEGLLSNPAFRAGVGILSDQQNPFQGALQGLASAQDFKTRKQQAMKQQQLDEELRRIFSEQQQQRAQQAGSNAAAQLRAQLPQGADSAAVQPGSVVNPPLTAPPPASISQQAAQSLLRFGTPEQQQQALQILGAQEQSQSQLDRMQQEFDFRREMAEKEISQRQQAADVAQRQKFQLEQFKTQQAAQRELQKQQINTAFAADRAAAEADSTFARERAKNIAEAKQKLPDLAENVDNLKRIANQIRSAPGATSQTGGIFGLQGRISRMKLGGDAVKFQNLLKEFNENLTLSLIPKLANTGPLSDSDVQILRDAAGGLDPLLSDADFAAKLDEIVERAEESLSNARRYAGESGPGVSQGQTAPELLPAEGNAQISAELNARLQQYLGNL